MFTGLVSDVGEVVAMERAGAGARLRIACGYALEDLSKGASIACAGVCLTATDLSRAAGGRTVFAADASGETLARTTLGGWREGARVNLERSLRAGDELGGHLVSGHVDGTARITARREEGGGSVRFDLEAPAALTRFIAEKGSVALDGTSLTVNGVSGSRFSVTLIPHTLAVTTWGDRLPGDIVNLEVDMMARYAARLLEGAFRA